MEESIFNLFSIHNEPRKAYSSIARGYIQAVCVFHMSANTPAQEQVYMSLKVPRYSLHTLAPICRHEREVNILPGYVYVRFRYVREQLSQHPPSAHCFGLEDTVKMT